MWYFAMMKSVIQLMFVLWCGVVTSAQDNGKKKEPLRKNATSFVLPSLTAVIISRITNATTMSTPTFHSTTEPLRENATSIVRPNRTAVVGTMNTTVMSTPTFHSTTEPLGGNATSIVRPNRTAVVGTMNATVMSTPTFHSTTERMTFNANDSGRSNFFLLIIIICSVAVVVLLIVGTKVLLYKRTNQGTAPRLGDGEANRRSAKEDMELKSRSSLNTNENKVIKDAVSMHPDVVTKLIPAYGGVIDIDGFILKIGPGCLAKDTEITLIKHHDRDFAIKSLLDLGLLEAVPRVIQFLPVGLKFLKPADLTIRFENTVSDCEPFILHGSYRHDYQRTVWELVTNGIKVNNVERVINSKINGFSFYSLISATGVMTLPRILSHLNRSFTCRAYPLYRRLSTMDPLEISVVIFSEFVDENKEEDIRQLKDLLDQGYVKGERGVLKRVHTNRHLGISLHFPGVENVPFRFDIDEPQLDSVGFVIDHFHDVSVKSPARGKVKISEVDCRDENESLWSMHIREMEEKFRVEEAKVIDSASNPEPKVVYSNTKLTKEEITRMSREVGPDWDSLAGLMDIPYFDREEIRVDNLNYLSIRSKAKKVFELFNDSTLFNRHILVKYFKELGRHDLENKLLPMEDQNGSEKVETPPTPPLITEEDLLHTRLSAREMSRFGRRIVQWANLASLLNILSEDIDNIRYSLIYNDNRARAEKILSIFNNMEGFSRKKLAGCLEEIQRLDLVEPVITGKWRKFTMYTDL